MQSILAESIGVINCVREGGKTEHYQVRSNRESGFVFEGKKVLIEER